VLHNISFRANPGEHIGIVGRTGSGKSSLVLALLRCIPSEGNVYYDGMLTSELPLESLRGNITTIPQVPELLAGTIRYNLDPFGQYDDATLHDALRASGITSLSSCSPEGGGGRRLALDSQISAGGNNVSVGQRQMIALARAILRKSKLLILDEATSSIDQETEDVIQRSLQSELDKDTTVLIIAHRLQTVLDADKIMVLDSGSIVEFGPPDELLKNEQGALRALVNQSRRGHGFLRFGDEEQD